MAYGSLRLFLVLKEAKRSMQLQFFWLPLLLYRGTDFDTAKHAYEVFECEFFVRKYIFSNSDDVCDPSCKGTVGSNESKGVGGP